MAVHRSEMPLVRQPLRWLTLYMDENLTPSRLVQRVGDLRSNGVPYDDFKRRIRDGTVCMIRHGAVAAGTDQTDQRRRHLELIAGTTPVLTGRRYVLSHTSAVALLGLPMVRDGARSVWINRPPGTSGYRSPLLVSRSCPLAADEIVRVGEYRVTSVGRTAIDMAREFGFVIGVVIADAALATGVSPQTLVDLVNRGARRAGNAVARAVCEVADGRSESPGESFMRALHHRYGCPPSELQVEIHDRHGRFVARCDFGWLEYGVVGEYDGPQKYLRSARPGESMSDVVVREKAREAEIRDQGLEVIRFCKADLRNPAAAAARLRRLLSQRGLRETPWSSPMAQVPPDDAGWARF